MPKALHELAVPTASPHPLAPGYRIVGWQVPNNEGDVGASIEFMAHVAASYEGTRAAMAEFEEALRRREHGGVAAWNLVHKLRRFFPKEETNG